MSINQHIDALGFMIRHALLFGVAAGMLGGCSHYNSLHDFHGIPKIRKGAVPCHSFPNKFVDPDRLGQHCYHYSLKERSGIVYTCYTAYMDQHIYRIIDANFNRAREALRVMEDYVRFILDDGRLSRLAKELRHDLRACMDQIAPEDLAGARDIIGDDGTEISTDSEGSRSDEKAVLTAAAKRLSEALRCMEEYAKIESTEMGAMLEKLRYRAYDLEKRIIRRADQAGPATMTLAGRSTRS